MTNKQAEFVKHYLATGDAKQAAKDAGYSCTTPSELLRNPAISKAVEDAKTSSAPHLVTGLGIIDEESVIRRLWQEANDFSEESSSAARVRALQLIGTKMGLFERRTEEDPFDDLKKRIPGGLSEAVMEQLAQFAAKALEEASATPDDVEISNGAGAVRQGSPESDVVGEAEGDSDLTNEASFSDPG